MVELVYRRATAADIGAIVAMLADDVIGSSRENISPNGMRKYFEAFSEIDADQNQFLCVAQDAQEIVGTLQITFIPGLARNGAKRGQIEAVRVARERRDEKLGEAIFKWAIGECRARGCSLIQLSTDRSRPDAHRFYERLGFEPTHIGYKLKLEP